MQSTAYEYVFAIAKHHSISKAAQELCITQPALTKYLKRLEEDLGTQLFDRTVSPLALTLAGKKFVEKAALILEIERSLQYDLNLISTDVRGKVTVGINTEFCNITIPYVLPEFRFRYPEIEVNLYEGNNQQLFTELEAGRIDIVYSAYSMSTKAFTYDRLCSEPILLAIPADHPLARDLDLSNNSPLTPYYMNPERIKNCDFIALIPEQGMGAIARDFFHKYNLNPHIVMEIQKHETAMRLASAGMGMVFTPVRTPLRIPLVKPMAYFSIENPLFTRSRGVYYSKYVPLSDAAKCFVQVFNEVYNHESTLRLPDCHLIVPPAQTLISNTGIV
ncbi:MAG: LysR family transcriptional regulator [Enterocloster asparagiformis]|nr:LysR family transcriptional regulator [Enterocloster asparagiformis]